MLVLPLVYRGGDLQSELLLRARAIPVPLQASCAQQPSTFLF